jgi:hypothetical protein
MEQPLVNYFTNKADCMTAGGAGKVRSGAISWLREVLKTARNVVIGDDGIE